MTMNDNHRPETERAFAASRESVDRLVGEHGIAAIVTMIGALVEWSIEHGAADLITRSLTNAVEMVPEAVAAWKGGPQ